MTSVWTAVGTTGKPVCIHAHDGKGNYWLAMYDEAGKLGPFEGPTPLVITVPEPPDIEKES